MNAKSIPAALLDFANMQLDQLSAKEKFSFAELTTVVDALFAMSGTQLSGSLVLVYVLMVRSLRIVVNVDSTLSLVCRRSLHYHELPDSLKPDLWLTENTHRRRAHTTYTITPLWVVKPTYSRLAQRSIVWLKSTNQGSRDTWLQMQTALSIADHTELVESRPVSMLFPAIVDGTLQIVNMPSSQFDEWHKTIGIKNAITITVGRHPSNTTLAATEPDLTLPAKTVKAFYDKTLERIIADKEKVDSVPERERSTLTFVLINCQRELHDLNLQIFK